jgi:hypothetical protein
MSMRVIGISAQETRQVALAYSQLWRELSLADTNLPAQPLELWTRWIRIHIAL